jgi:hypothetical protein
MNSLLHVALDHSLFSYKPQKIKCVYAMKYNQINILKLNLFILVFSLIFHL